MCGAFSGRATSTAAVGVVHDSFISYSDGRRHRWSHNPFCVNRHDIFQNSTAEQRQFNETPSQRHVFCGKRHNPAASASSRTRRQRCECRPHAKSQPNQQRAPPRNGRAGQKSRGRRGGTYPATRGECACPAWDDAECTHTSHGSSGHVSREGGRNNRSILRVSGDSSKLHEMNPRKHRAASHKAGACASRMRCAGTPRPASPLTSPATPKRNTQEWQDLRAVHDSRGPCSESGPFMARSSRGVFPNGCLQGFSDAWRAYPAKASPFSDAWRANLATNWRFSRPRHLLGYMKRKTCHGLPPGNAPGRNIAIARHPRTHRGVAEAGDAARTEHRPIQHHALTRPRNHENILVPSAKKRR